MSDAKPPETGDADAARPLRPVPADRYKDFLPVGEGGMGIVYWAIDADLKRQVAFKIVRPPSDSRHGGVTPPVPFALAAPEHGNSELDQAFEHLKARFLHEAWVTGGMEHPGIVPVYELGRTEAGVPYYTMKFVRGSRTLTTAIGEVAEAPFETRAALLEPFLKVCDTIRYAHSRGVVHRDLKPDNIALGEFGEVVVLDWGLAKLGDELASQHSRWQGGVHEHREAFGLQTIASAVGTPGYMAPEAAEGMPERVDARSDVYSLGVILFEILTAQRPFGFTNFREYQRQVTSQEAPEARLIDNDVPEALSAACRNALARDPAERTESVEALTTALRAWQTSRAQDREIETLLAEADAALSATTDLHGAALLKQLDRATAATRRVLALRAEHAGAQERLAAAEAARERGIAERERSARGRTLRRAGAVGLAAAALAAVAVAWVLDDKREESERARRAASSARGEAEDVMGFMVGEMRTSLEPIGRLDLLAKIGEEARTYYENLPADARTPASLRNGALALHSLGDVHYAQGNLPSAKGAYEASAALAGLLSERRGDAESAYLLSQAQAGLGAVLIAQGYPSRAIAYLEAHLEAVDERLGAAPDSHALQAARDEAHHLLGQARGRAFEVERALEHASEALRGAEARAKGDDADGSAARDVARYLMAPLRLLGLRERMSEVEARLDKANALISARLATQPDDARWRWLRVQLRVHQGRLAETTRELAKAGASYAAAQEELTELRRVDPDHAGYLEREGHILHRRGYVLRALEIERGTQAEKVTAHHESWRQAYAIQRKLLERDPSNAYWMHAMIGLCDRMSWVIHETTRDLPRAEAYREEALDWARKLVANDEANVLWRHLLAYTLHQHARRRQSLEPERSHEQQLEVIALCRALAEHYPDGLAEVAVLHGWAVSTLDTKRIDTPAYLAHRREALRLLDRAREASPKRVDILLTTCRERITFARILAVKDPGKRADALALLEPVGGLLAKARELTAEGSQDRKATDAAEEDLAKLQRTLEDR